MKFTELDGRRVAYATVGEGPPLVFGGRWVTHLEREWADAHARSAQIHKRRAHSIERARLLAMDTRRQRQPSSARATEWRFVAEGVEGRAWRRRKRNEAS